MEHGCTYISLQESRHTPELEVFRMGSLLEKKKANILLIRGGAVGTIVALNIERGGLGKVNMILRSNFKTIAEKVYTIESVDHGKIEGWKPTQGT